MTRPKITIESPNAPQNFEPKCGLSPNNRPDFFLSPYTPGCENQFPTPTSISMSAPPTQGYSDLGCRPTGVCCWSLEIPAHF